MRRFTLGSLPMLGLWLAALALAAPPQTATVTFDPDKASTARLTQATTEAGFPSKLIAKP
jgi:hypothetical protein